MNIETWQEALGHDRPLLACGAVGEAMQTEIDALRAEIGRINSGWYDKLLQTTLERDALRKDCALLNEVCEQMIIGAVNTVDIVQDADRLAVENAAQRKVLEQALDALVRARARKIGFDDLDKTITAIQEQLK